MILKEGHPNVGARMHFVLEVAVAHLAAIMQDTFGLTGLPFIDIDQAQINLARWHIADLAGADNETDYYQEQP